MSEPEISFEQAVTVGAGETHVVDADYLDPVNEIEGVIAVQADQDGGLWALYGIRDEAGAYHQVWFQPGRNKPQVPATERKTRLKPVI